MCIICEKGKSLAILQQILVSLERENCDDLEAYQFVQRKFNELKDEMDAIEETMKESVREWQQENSLFYPVVDDKKQALKN